MLFSYGYGRWQNWRCHQNAPPLQLILKALRMRRSNTDSIVQCGMSRATTKAIGCRHRATTHSVLPQQLPGQQAYKQQSTNTRAKMAISMAMVMCWYVTAHIAWWRRSRASQEATGCRHWASIMPNNIVWTWLRRFFLCFHRQNRRKRSRVNAKNPVFNRGVTYQTKEKGLIKVTI